MDKKYIITFSISVMVMITLTIVMLMLMIPQQNIITSSELKNYNEILKSEYTFSNSKNISKDTLIQEYDVNSEDMQKYERYNQYKPGNADPFTPKDDLEESNEVDNSKENTTNSNNGVPNPESTTK